MPRLRKASLPGALLPDDPATAAAGDWYNNGVLAKFPLSSKSHWDVPIRIGDRVIHLLASHPTPPVFDGAEDRNGRRNHDEIRFWRDYVTPESSDYIDDDDGRHGGLAAGASFVIAGDLNCDPHDGDSTGFPIRLLLQSKRVGTGHAPASDGAAESSRLNRGANEAQRGDPHHDTGEYASVGNLRLDYVLPSSDLKVTGSGVYWPEKNNEYEAKLVEKASDHRLVWIDVTLD